MVVPPRGPDGAPYQCIFVGPTPEHRGSAIRLRLVTATGGEVPDDADVLLETYYKTGAERTVIFQGKYGQFKAIPDQHAPDAAVAQPETSHRLLYDFLVGAEEELPDVVQV